MRHPADKQMDAQLEHIPGLARATTTERAALARHGTEIEVGPGTVLVRRGRMANQAILLLGGSARSRDCRSSCYFKAGAVVGDTSSHDARPQTATVETVEPTKLLVHTHQEFACLSADAPRLADELRVRIGVGRLAAVAGLADDESHEAVNRELEATGAITGVAPEPRSARPRR